MVVECGLEDLNRLLEIQRNRAPVTVNGVPSMVLASLQILDGAYIRAQFVKVELVHDSRRRPVVLRDLGNQPDR